VLIVRLLLFLAIAIVVVAGGLYLFTHDRRYLRFLVLVVKFMICILAGILVFMLLERLVIMV
jgi:hypothetical protein